jgi:hypothetical protein
MIGNSFPTTEVATNGGDTEESLLETALRGLGEQISTKNGQSKKGEGSNTSKLPLDLYCPSNAPIAVRMEPYDADQQKSTGFYGIKTFFVKVQYDDGKITNKDVEFAWLDRSEVVDRMEGTLGQEEAKFYKYML